MLYSRCADPACLEPLMQVTWHGQSSHPTCQQTEAEILARRFVDAVQRGNEREANRLEKLLNRVDEPPSLGSAALWYASVGWPIFPLKPGQKVPATKHGLKDATLDQDLIRHWWTKHPDSNIGGLTGHLYDVVDVDGIEGVRSLADLGEGVLPDVHGKAATPRGFHYFVLPTGDGNRAAVRPGLDYRGRSGFVVLSPSVVNGRRYSWLMTPSPQIMRTP